MASFSSPGDEELNKQPHQKESFAAIKTVKTSRLGKFCGKLAQKCKPCISAVFCAVDTTATTVYSVHHDEQLQPTYCSSEETPSILHGFDDEGTKQASMPTQHLRCATGSEREYFSLEDTGYDGLELELEPDGLLESGSDTSSDVGLNSYTRTDPSIFRQKTKKMLFMKKGMKRGIIGASSNLRKGRRRLSNGWRSNKQARLDNNSIDFEGTAFPSQQLRTRTSLFPVKEVDSLSLSDGEDDSSVEEENVKNLEIV